MCNFIDSKIQSPNPHSRLLRAGRAADATLDSRRPSSLLVSLLRLPAPAGCARAQPLKRTISIHNQYCIYSIFIKVKHNPTILNSKKRIQNVLYHFWRTGRRFHRPPQNISRAKQIPDQHVECPLCRWMQYIPLVGELLWQAK